jgi:hypothetical protein
LSASGAAYAPPLLSGGLAPRRSPRFVYLSPDDPCRLTPHPTDRVPPASQKGFCMSAGTARSLPLLVLVALACCGCQNVPDRRDLARAQPRPAAGGGTVRAVAPLRISDPPAAVATSAPPDGLPALPQPPSAPAESDLRRLYRLAAAQYAGIDGYIVRLIRREQVNGKDQPREIIRLSFRKEPWSVHFVWLEGEAKGREVVYVKGRYDDKLHTRLGPTDANLVMRAGSHIALALDSPMVRNSSRHSITDAGIGALIDRYGALLAANEKGDRRWGTLSYLGPQKRPEFEGPVETVEQAVPPGADKDLPRGGRRLWMFDGKTRLPALVVTIDDRGHEVEYYLHDRLIPTQFEDRDFDPDRLWARP